MYQTSQVSDFQQLTRVSKMAKLLSDSSAEDFRRMQQAFKNPGTKAPSASYRPSVDWIMMKLVTDQGNDLWTAKAVAFNTTTYVWDDITSGRQTSVTVPLLVQGGGNADDIVRAFPSRDTDGDPLWVAVKGGGTSQFYIEITATTNISTYTGTIYDNPINRTLVESGVTVRALQHDAGTIPNSDSGEGFWCIYDADNDVYHITNYSVFYG